MRAGDGGELLVRTWNDLHLLATAASGPDQESLKLEEPSGGCTPVTWRTGFHPAARRLRVRDGRGDGYTRASPPPPGLVPGERRFDNQHMASDVTAWLPNLTPPTQGQRGPR